MFDSLDFVLNALSRKETSSSPAVDWATAELEVGSPLPADYKAFATRLGAGVLDDVLFVHCPDGSDRSLVEANRLADSALARIQESGEIGLIEDYVLRTPPRKSAVRWIRWGSTVGGGGLFWLASEDESPELWPTFFHELDHYPYGEFYGLGFSDLLAGLLRGTVETDYLDEIAESPAHRYVLHSG